MTMEFNFILSNNSANECFPSTNTESESILSSIDDNNASASILETAANDEGSIDSFGGKDMFGSCDVSNISETNFVASDDAETAGNVAYDAGETMGSVAFAGSGAETAGSVACASDGGSSDGGGCSCGGFSSFC